MTPINTLPKDLVLEILDYSHEPNARLVNKEFNQAFKDLNIAERIKKCLPTEIANVFEKSLFSKKITMLYDLSDSSQDMAFSTSMAKMFVSFINGNPLKDVSEKLKNNREIVLAAVQQNGLALEFASNRLKNNREIVLAAVQQNGLALWSASIKLKKVKEIVEAATQQNGIARMFAR